jgi:tetratricopeptide (TPR) repeat protein
MSTKSALKSVRIALDSRDFEDAAEKARAVVKHEPQNYHANVFLGLALDKLNKNEESERAYLAATRAKSDDKTAWQGLANLYEKQGGFKLDDYHEAALRLGQIFAEVYVSCSTLYIRRTGANLTLATTSTVARMSWTNISSSQRNRALDRNIRRPSNYTSQRVRFMATSKDGYHILPIHTSAS